jgi:glycosyltransferase involved in cell wall biosynthesis
MQHPAVIWIVNHYAQEPSGPGGTRHFSLARQLQKQGFAPYIIASGTTHNVGTQRLAEGQLLRVDWIENIPFIWLHTAAHNGNELKRLFSMIGFARRVMNKKLIESIPKPDIVIGSTPDPFAALAAQRVAARHKAIFIYEIRDLWPLSLIELKKIKPLHPLALVMSGIERFLCRQAKRILVVQQYTHQYLTPRGIDLKKIIYLPNGIDLTLFPEPEAKQPEDRFTFMYFGAHGNGNALQNVLYAMKIIETKDTTGRIRLRLIGDGPHKRMLQNLAQSLGLQHVSFEPPIPKRDIALLATQADAFVFNVVDMPLLRFGISANKLFDYMASKRPVVFACNAAGDPISAAQSGINVAAAKPEALADAMIALAALPHSELQAMGQRGRDYVSAVHGIEALGKTLGDTINSALGGRL